MANETIAPGTAMYRYFFSCGSSAGKHEGDDLIGDDRQRQHQRHHHRDLEVGDEPLARA